MNPKTKNIIYIIVTVAIGALFCLLKIKSIGWITILFVIPILLFFALYIAHNVIFIKKTNKTAINYLLFWIASVFFLLSALTFADVTDLSESYIIKSIPWQTSMYLCSISVGICIFLMVFHIVYMLKAKQNKRKTRLPKTHR